MVLQRRLYYGFTGHQVPVVPRASRSFRGRRSFGKKFEANQIRAFEILANVAGNLLQEGENSAPANAPSGGALLDVVVDTGKHYQEDCAKMSKLDSLEGGSCVPSFAFVPKLRGGRHSYSLREISPAQHATEVDTSSPASTSSHSNIEATLSRDNIVTRPSSGRCLDINEVERGDDEKSVRCSQYGTAVKNHRPLLHTEDQRIRKMSASSYFRAAPNFKWGSLRTDGKIKPCYDCGRTCYNHQRSQKMFPLKKRRIFDQNLLSTSNGAFHCEHVFNFHDRRTNASRASSSISGQQASANLRDCNVKLSIKSFNVPELFVEIPATATVGSLKRTVSEAVTALLGDGLRVGILVQGKKVRDDNKTLLQTGISKEDKNCSLGFTLEPRHALIQPPTCTKGPSFQSSDTFMDLSRHTASSTLQSGMSSVSPVSQESDFGTVPFLASTLTDNAVSGSKSLVAIPTISVEALAVVPFRHKSGNPEFGQRRIRRPFSVPEVEALVQAVESLGTGRWRDVKLRAFDNANHRTYVDLKDKWKTLVHTARISPQQRRGEPVPQELLNRVLAAHTYWSQQQVKQHF